MDLMVNEICSNGSGNTYERNSEDASDLPPEYCRYKDEGCELAESCLNCPFPHCIFDEPRGKQRWLKQVRDHEIRKLFDRGSRTRELGVMFGLSRRTIQRALKNANRTGRARNNESEEKGRGPYR
jgi:hypothetical protein